MSWRAQLQNILKRKHHSIPDSLRHWLFFQKHVLENAKQRNLFKQDLSRAQFDALLRQPNLLKHAQRQPRRISKKTKMNLHADSTSALFCYYKWLLHPSESPVDVRPSDHGGLGLFLKEPLPFKKGEKLDWLHAFVVSVGDKDFASLCAAGYDSLWGANRFIIGPLALVNHACLAKLAFGNVCRKPVVNEFGKIPHISLVARQSGVLPAGAELLVDYYDLQRENYRPPTKVFGRDCNCTRCAAQPPSSS